MHRVHNCALSRIAVVAAVLAAMAGSTSVQAAWTITMVNETTRTLTFYAVNEEPPPQRLPSTTIAHGDTFTIDPAGFNPVFAWPGGIDTSGVSPNGFFIGLALDASPPLIQFKRFHYKVTPGTTGGDPALQPDLFDQRIVEVTEGEIQIVVDTAFNATIGPPMPPRACCKLTGCTDVRLASACADGRLVDGVTCTPTLCTSAGETVGATGGTVETPDGAVSVEFPPDCLASDTAISIEEGDYPSTLYDIELTDSPGSTFEVHMAYTFEPSNLDFCPEAQLCMTFDRTALGLEPAQCAELRFFHRDRICGFDPDADCVTGADCPPSVSCHDAYHTDAATCECPTGSNVGTCCGNIHHFSDYILVSPADDRPTCPPCCRCGCRRRCTSACGRGIVPCLGMMFLALGLAKDRRRHVARRVRAR